MIAVYGHARTMVLTDEQRDQVRAAMEALERGQTMEQSVVPELITSDARVRLDTELADLLITMLTALREGQGVSLVPLHRLLTTQEAADMLNISRPTLVKVLERGDIPFERVGRHRRVRLRDLLEYQEAIAARRSDALDRMQADAEENGLYEMLDGPGSRHEG